MNQDADPSDVAFPAAQLLVQRGHARNLLVQNGQQRQVASQVNVLAPLADDRDFRDAMFDEHAFVFRDSEEQLVKLFLVGLAQGPQGDFRAVFQRDFLRKFLEFEFN